MNPLSEMSKLSKINKKVKKQNKTYLVEVQMMNKFASDTSILCGFDTSCKMWLLDLWKEIMKKYKFEWEDKGSEILFMEMRS